MNRSTNASAESLNAKIKDFRAQLRGVIDKKFFIFRLSKFSVNPRGYAGDPIFILPSRQAIAHTSDADAS